MESSEEEEVQKINSFVHEARSYCMMKEGRGATASVGSPVLDFLLKHPDEIEGILKRSLRTILCEFCADKLDTHRARHFSLGFVLYCGLNSGALSCPSPS